MIIEVMLVVCLNAAQRIGCTNIPVADNTQAQDNGAEVNMTGCMGLEGLTSAQQYWDAHQELHDSYQFGGWACKIGNKKLPDNKRA